MAEQQNIPPGFEAAVQELAQLVETLENDTLSVEEALQHFERGIQLTRHCQRVLDEAEQRVEQVLAEGRLQAMILTDNDLS